MKKSLYLRLLCTLYGCAVMAAEVRNDADGLVVKKLIVSAEEQQRLSRLEQEGVQVIRPVALPAGRYLVGENHHLGWPVGIKIGNTLLCAYHQTLRHHGGTRQDKNSSDAVVVRSTDGGETWSDPIDVRQFGTSKKPMVLGFGNCFGVLADKVFLATTYGLYHSKDEGKTWQHERFPLSDTIHPLEPTALYHEGRPIFLSRNHTLPFKGHHPLRITRTLDTEKFSNAMRPNILIIFTDDQGYADLGCFGSKKNKTPRMDRLAKEGTRFSNFYAQHVCGPSRSALLTGRYPIRSKGWNMPASEITFAELIRPAGYQTACIGKWDVSSRKPILERMPNAQGFDYYFGTLGANDGGHVAFHENNEAAGSTNDMSCLTRLYTDKAIDFLKNKRDPKKPFLLYLAHTMMHMNIDASEKFQGQSAGGLYGDVVEEFDYETGRLLDAIDELGLRDNTLVIYTTDNGPWNQPDYVNRKRQEKGYLKWKQEHAHFKNDDIFWGDSGPLRNGKGSCYEGGCRVPCIVRWPGKVAAGATSDAIFATIDLLPTFAALAGFNVPEDRLIDGVDQTALLLGRNKEGSRETFFYVNAMRKGKWKYLKANHCMYGYARDRNRQAVEELYDLEADLGETVNLADQHPEKVAELKALLEETAAAEAR